MLETIGTLAIMGIITLFGVFVGYVVIVGEREDAREEKEDIRVSLERQKSPEVFLTHEEVERVIELREADRKKREQNE